MDIEALVKVILSDEEMWQKIVELRQSLVVYVAETGDDYHKSKTCHFFRAGRGPRREPMEVSLKSVKELEYKPCPRCYPDEG